MLKRKGVRRKSQTAKKDEATTSSLQRKKGGVSALKRTLRKRSGKQKIAGNLKKKKKSGFTCSYG